MAYQDSQIDEDRLRQEIKKELEHDFKKRYKPQKKNTGLRSCCGCLLAILIVVGIGAAFFLKTGRVTIPFVGDIWHKENVPLRWVDMGEGGPLELGEILEPKIEEAVGRKVSGLHDIVGLFSNKESALIDLELTESELSRMLSGLIEEDLDQGEGLLWGLLAGTLYGFFSGYSSTVPGDSHSVFLLSAIGASLLAMLPLAWTERHLLGSLPPGAYLAAVGQGCLMNGMGYFLWTSALREARQQGMAVASITSLIFFLPLTSLTVISVAFRDTEVLRPYFLGTLLLLLGGLGLCQWTDRIVGWIDGRRVRGWEGLNDNG